MRILIVYATREGQTRRIASRIADDLVARRISVDMFDARRIGTLDWSKYATACVAASVHTGRHEKEIVAFVKQHRAELERVRAAFISVSLSEVGAEDASRTDADRQQAAADVQRMIDDFVKETGWTPARIFPVAGSLAYTKYNLLVRFIMKRIARQQGAPTDTSRDYEFTNWKAVDDFAQELGTDADAVAVTDSLTR